MGRQPRLFAGLNVLDLEVAAIGDDIDILDIENGAGQLGGLFQQAHVHDLIGHSLLDDHFVLRVDRDLDVVADANLRMGGHRPAVGISQRYLVLAGSFKIRQHRPVPAAFLAERLDLLGQVSRARAAARSAFLDIALVQPSAARMKSCSEFRVKLRSLLLTALIRVPSTASNSRP